MHDIKERSAKVGTKLLKGKTQEIRNPIKLPTRIEMLCCNPYLLERSTMLFCFEKCSITAVLDI